MRTLTMPRTRGDTGPGLGSNKTTALFSVGDSAGVLGLPGLTLSPFGVNGLYPPKNLGRLGYVPDDGFGIGGPLDHIGGGLPDPDGDGETADDPEKELVGV